jgi:hypothetical protein
VITCYVRYELNMEQLDAFAEYAKIWIDLVNKLGGTHHGYFLPCLEDKAREHGRFSFPGMGKEGPTNVGIAVFSFPSWAAYEHYRAEADKCDECKRATEIVQETKCFTAYERNFMTPILGDKRGTTHADNLSNDPQA